jgi:hypothetical protein
MEDPFGTKQTILTTAPIEGWFCMLEPTSNISEPIFKCTPSDEYIRVRAYFRSDTQSPPDSTPFAYWITAESDFIAAKGNDLTPLGD